jgi:hypothetical protein
VERGWRSTAATQQPPPPPLLLLLLLSFCFVQRVSLLHCTVAWQSLPAAV